MPLEDFSAYCWAIYRAFDEGEYLHPGQAAGTNEELFTRPLLMKEKSDFFPDVTGEVGQQRPFENLVIVGQLPDKLLRLNLKKYD
jgi:hypothetical protein